jgi:hypothetical protein
VPACGALGRLLVAHVTSEKDVDRGMVLLETACADGDAASCAALGAIYRERGDEKALARSEELLKRACDLKSAEGCASLGVLEEAWERHDPRPVLEAYRRSCELGYPKGCELYAFAQKRQSPGDRRAGEEAFIRACSLGDLPSCHGLGRSRIAKPATLADGVAYLMKACEGGFVPSCVTAAELFAPVVGAAASWERALPVADRACARKEEDACAIADASRLEGRREVPAAAQRLRAACDGGIALACFYWANAAGASATAEAVLQAYGLACQGHSSLIRPLACTRFAVLRLTTATSAEEAEPLTKALEAACARSVGEACCAVAEIQAAGRWSPADATKASDTRQKACNLGAQKCCGR